MTTVVSTNAPRLLQVSVVTTQVKKILNLNIMSQDLVSMKQTLVTSRMMLVKYLDLSFQEAKLLLKTNLQI